MGFPETNWTLIREASQTDPARALQALASLCASYREPVRRWLLAVGVSPQRVEDTAHDLFEQWLDRGRLPDCQPGCGRFRHYLTTSLRNLVRDHHAAAVREKRGGGAVHLPLERVNLVAQDARLERQLDLQFARSVHEHALKTVADQWTSAHRQRKFERLQRFVLRSPVDGEYRQAAEVLQLSSAQVKRAVSDLREDYFTAFRAEVTCLTVPEEAAEEVRYLVGLLAESLS